MDRLEIVEADITTLEVEELMELFTELPAKSCWRNAGC